MEKFYLYTTNKCNQRCLFCVRLGENEKLNKQPSFDDLKNQISNMPDKAKTVLFFDGGEPTLYENFLPLIEHALSAGIKKMAILTNATRFSDSKFTDELFRRFKGKKDVELSFSVSLHSHIEEISDKLTNSKGTYKLTLKGLENLLAHTNKISVYHIMTSYNYDKLEDFCRFIVESFPQIKAVTLSFIYPRGNPLKHKEIFPNFSKLKKHLLNAICYLEEHNVNVSVPVCGTIPLCAIEGHEEYVIDQLERDTAENVKLFDSSGYHDYILSEKYFHEATKVKSVKCTHCILNSICKGIWNVYVDLYGFDGVEPLLINNCKYKIIDVNVDSDFESISSLLKGYKKIVILNFITKNGKSPLGAGNRIEKFLEDLKDMGIHFVVARPVPKKFFEGYEQYKRLVEKFNIPASCKDCLYLLMKKDDDYYLCGNKKISIKKDVLEKDKDNIYNAFQSRLPKICNESLGLKAETDKKDSGKYNLDKKIEIVVGFSCNNNCKFCSVGIRRTNMRLEEIKWEIDKAAEERPREINFTGGEPTIRKDIFEIVSYARGKVDSTRITTNGRMLSYGWFAKKLVDAGATGFIFSLHGPDAKIHDYLTSAKGSFDQLIKGMENCSKLVDDISLNIVVTTLNYKSLPEIIKATIDRFNVKIYCIIFPTVDGNLIDNKRIIPRYEDIRPYVHEALEIVRKRGRDGWIFNVPPCFLDKEETYSGTVDYNTIMYWPDIITDLDQKKYEGKIKIDKCKKCSFDKKCPGIPKDYFNVYMTDKKYRKGAQ